MPLLAQLRSWLRATLLRSRAEREMDSELRAHLENRIDDLVRAGLTRDAAHRRARLEFGGIENFKEACRDAKGSNVLESIFQDVRFALRMLRKSPGFTAVAVLTLALGIGANTAVFSVVHAVILRPLPFKDSQRMFAVSLHTPMFPTFSLGLPWPAFQAIRSGVPALQESSVYAAKERTLTGDGSPAVLEIADVSEGYFPQFGMQPQLGRLFSEGDFHAGDNRVLVLSDKLWRTRFGADAQVLGKKLILDKESWTVIGVASRGFDYPGEQAWAPLVLTDKEKITQTFFMLQFIGKLRAGQTVDQLKSQLNAVAHRLVTDNPDLGEGYSFTPQNLLDSEIENVRSVYFMLLGAATLVLLIACANLASLLLARGTGRRREMAMRAALGASRSRLLRQGLVESCLLALLGGALGVLLAGGGVQLFRAIAPEDTPRLAEISVDATLLWFSLATALLAGILFGIAPARRASRLYPNEALKEGTGASLGTARSASQMRLGKSLVVVEVALAFILLVGSALTVQTVTKLLHQETGFRTDHLLTFDLPQAVDQNTAPTLKRIAEDNDRLDRVFAQIARIPGVAGVTASSHGILGGMSMMMSGLDVQGALPERPGAQRHAVARYVDPSYFSTLGIPLVRGRDFTPRVGEKTPSEIVVNEAMAQEYWGTLDVIGKHISFSRGEDGKPVWSDVIAVVANARETSISIAPQPAYYVSMRQTTNGQQHIFVRTQGAPTALSATITQQLWSLSPDQPVSDVTTMTQVIAKSVGDQRLRGILLTVFALVGFSLALVGAYGVISFSVSRRVQEIGVRMALGARSTDVLRMILLQGLLLVSLGVALGAGAAFGLARLIASQLYGVTPGDPLTFLAAAALVFLIAALACLIPARRASRVDPIVALRYE